MKTPVVKVPFAAVAAVILAATLPMPNFAAENFVVAKLDGKAPTSTNNLAIVGSRCDKSGACTEIELATGELTIEDPELWVAWGATDGKGDISAFDHKAKLTAVSARSRYKVSVPKGPRYLCFYLSGRRLPGKGDGKAMIETPVVLDKNAKMTVVFRVSDFETGQGVAGSRGGARDRNFALSVGDNCICLDYNDCKSGTIVGRLSVTEGLDTTHWYQAEISASQRKVTDLTTGRTWMNDDSAAASYDFKTPTSCLFFGVGNGSWTSNFKGDIRSFVLETNGTEAVHYEGVVVDGVPVFMELVSGTAAQVKGGSVTFEGTYLTESCSIGPDEFGSGRSIDLVKPVGARSNPTAHRLVFGPSNGQDYLLVQCCGLSPQGSAYQSWGKYRIVDLIPATSNEFACAVPPGWGQDYTLVRYFLIKPAAKANGGIVDTGVLLQSGDTMSVEFNIGTLSVLQTGIAGCRAGTAVTNISVCAASENGSADYAAIRGEYNNGTSGCNLSVDHRATAHWYKMEVSPDHRILTKLDTGTAWTNDVPYADEPFVTTETCLLFFCRSMSENWDKFPGSIAHFSVMRENKKIIDLFPQSDGGKTYFLDLVTGGKFYGKGAELTFERRDEAMGASRTINARRSAGFVLLLK